MGFVKEQILKADRDKYGIKIDFRQTKVAFWTIDRERDIWIRRVVPDKERRDIPIISMDYDFYWKGTIMELSIFAEAPKRTPANNDTPAHIHWQLKIEYMDIPDNLISKRSEILKDLYEAIYVEYSPAEISFMPKKTASMEINSDNAGKKEYIPKDKKRPVYEAYVGLPVKGFVREYIHDEDYETYGLESGSFDRLKGGQSHWTIDRERNIWLRFYSRFFNRDEQSSGPDSEWVFYWKGTFMAIDIEDIKRDWIMLNPDAPYTERISDLDWHFKINLMKIPKELAGKRDEILKDLKDAFIAEAYGENGGKITLTMDVKNVTDRKRV